jgi:cellulose synthase/poly-beta-1,6-N-acetylglucosamine synthase-like glycosyltransferase
VSAEVVFWVSAGIALYVYVGYPLLLTPLRLVFSQPVNKRPIEPFVSLLIPAYNEAHVIAAKIQNVLTLDYPPELLEIVVASDGSTDKTAEIANEVAAGTRIKVNTYSINRGKLAVLNESVPQLQGSVIAFSDASSMLSPDAIRHLVANFADPRVGAVSGIYKVLKKEEATLGTQEGLYWRYETFLKQQEAALGVVLGAHGSLYAIRKELYPFPPASTINDDFVIPVRILQMGYRVAYEPSAVAYEEAHEMAGFTRRARIMTGNFEQLRELKALVQPPKIFPLFVFMSHKVGRLIVPLCLLTLAVSNLFLLRVPLYFWMGVSQAMFYLLAILGAIFQLKPRALRLPFYFCSLNISVFYGLYYALWAPHRVAWNKD